MSDKKNQLEKAAADSVQRNGLKNLSFRTLADQVGIKSASVHYYFPGKTDLANSLIENYGHDFELYLSDINSKHSQLTDRLGGFIAVFESALKDGKICLCGMIAAEVETLDAQSRDLLAHYFEVGEAWLASILEAGQEQLITSLAPQTLAKVIMSGLEGAILLDRVDGGTVRLEAQRDLIHSFLK